MGEEMGLGFGGGGGGMAGGTFRVRSRAEGARADRLQADVRSAKCGLCANSTL